jgi:hypothetical protein
VMLVPRESPVAFVRVDPLTVSTLTADVTNGSSVTLTINNAITGLEVGAKIQMSGIHENTLGEVTTVISKTSGAVFTANILSSYTAGARVALVSPTNHFMYGNKLAYNSVGSYSIGDAVWIRTNTALQLYYVQAARRDFSPIMPGMLFGTIEGRELYLVQDHGAIIVTGDLDAPEGNLHAIGPYYSFTSPDDSIAMLGSEFGQNAILFQIRKADGGTW